jgi:hypothetical protein
MWLLNKLKAKDAAVCQPILHVNISCRQHSKYQALWERCVEEQKIAARGERHEHPIDIDLSGLG